MYYHLPSNLNQVVLRYFWIPLDMDLRTHYKIICNLTVERWKMLHTQLTCLRKEFHAWKHRKFTTRLIRYLPPTASLEGSEAGSCASINMGKGGRTFLQFWKLKKNNKFTLHKANWVSIFVKSTILYFCIIFQERTPKPPFYWGLSLAPQIPHMELLVTIAQGC